MDENRSSIVVNFIVRAVVGLGVIFFTNEILASKGISVAVGLIIPFTIYEVKNKKVNAMVDFFK